MYAHHNLAWSFDLGAPQDSKTYLNKHFIGELVFEVQDFQYKKVIISSEAFCGRSSVEKYEEIINALSPFFQIKVLMYLRRPDKYLISAYAEQCASGNTIDFDSWFDFKRYQVLSLLNSLEGVFGKENLHLKLYDDVSENLLEDLYSYLGINDLEGIALNKQRVNQSLSPQDLSDVRQINLYTNKRHCSKVRHFFRNRSKNYKSHNNGISIASKAQLTKIFNEALTDLSEIKERFFPRKSTLFDWDIEKELQSHIQFAEIIRPESELELIVSEILEQKRTT
ncbi:MAG: hypothetical protein RIC80_04220 [Cyclobacteriaceae bacterium]